MNVRLYLRQFLVLLSGTAAAQAINFAAYPVITRLYTPEAFGVFAIFVTAVGVIGPIAAGRFDLIVQSSPDHRTLAVYRLSLRLSLLFAAAATIAGLVYATYDDAATIIHALLLGLSVYLSGYCFAAIALALRRERYDLSARSQIFRTLLTVIAQIGLFFVLPPVDALILGFVVGFALQAVTLDLGLRGATTRRSRPRFLATMWRRYRWQASVDVVASTIGSLALHAFNLFLLFLYSTREVGHYALAFRVAVLPLTLFAGSLSEVYFQKAAASFRKTGTFWAELRFNLVSASAAAVLIFVPMVLLARPVFAFVFGSEWVPAADILIWLAPMLAIRFVYVAILTTPMVVGKSHWLFSINASLLAAMTLIFLWADAAAVSMRIYLLVNTAALSGIYLLYSLFLVQRVYRRYRLPSAVDK